ncbi:MAG: hypothetical protein ACR2OB_06120 [Solirubrobacteraceae bacterium]
MTASQDPSFDPRAIIAALERKRVTYVLIGGLARVLRGADEITDGVDICPTFGRDNIDRLERATSELDARRRDGQPLVWSEQAIDGDPVLALSTQFGTLNIVGTPAGVPRGCVDLRHVATKEHLGYGLQPFVASAGDLARMAAALHRGQDVARLPELRRIMELETDREQTLAPTVASPPLRADRSRRLEREGPEHGPRLSH